MESSMPVLKTVKTATAPFKLFQSILARIVGAEKAAALMKYFVFAFGGGVGWLILEAVTFVFHSLLGFYDIVAYTIGLVPNIAFNFFFHRYVTFRVRSVSQGKVALFAAIFLVIVGLNFLLVLFFRHVVHVNIYVSILFAVFILSIVNFLLNRFFVFS